MAILFSLISFIFNLITLPAFAQTGSISVSPSIVRLDLQQDKPEAEVTYTNHTNSPIELTFSARDFAPLEDGYKISFFEQPNPQNYKYSLSSWISFDKQTIDLNSGESGKLILLVDANKLTPGAHYASILADVQEKSSNAYADTVHIKTVLSSLLFIRTNTGREIEDGHISTFAPVRD